MSVFLSSFFFYLSTVSIRWAKGEVSLDPAFFAFARFALGAITFWIVILLKRKPIRFVHKGYLSARAFFNTIAVLVFFKAVSVTSSSEANILNMTYPLFIGMISW
ncbi:MAG: EamA family transporter, partial [Spirochaetota bacterium]